MNPTQVIAKLVVVTCLTSRLTFPLHAQDAAPRDRNPVKTRARPGDMMADSPVTFPEKGALPSKFPPDVRTVSTPTEKGYYLFSSPCCSLAQIAAIRAEMPPGDFTRPANDWRYLQRTRCILIKGGDLHILALGDSIVNDTMRSGWVALLQQAYPQARIRATVCVRGGGGCQHFKEQARIAKNVIPRQPDLVLIGGISQKSIADIQTVIRQLRQGLPQVEILLFSGTFGTKDPRDAAALANARHSGTGEYGAQLQALAQAEHCAYLDMTGPWARYIVTSGLHPHRFYRDVVHANAYGEQILAKILMAFFTTTASDSQELVANGHFESASPQTVPRHWQVWQPDWARACCQIAYTSDGVRISAGQTPYSIGGLYQDIDGIRGGQAYRIQVRGRIQALADPQQALLVRVTWRQKGEALHPAGMLVQGPKVQGEHVTFADVLTAPRDADSAQLALEAKWLKQGTVTWQQASMQAVPAPAPRTVKIGTVFLRPRNSTPEKNLDLWCAQIDQAGRLGLDIVCLGEVITKVGTSASSADCARPIPGPITERLGRAARAHGIWVVAGLTEAHGKDIYNTAILLDRQGQLAGTYRKVHLPREEWKQGIRPGHAYPVFKTDFGVIAMEICYDWFFPETETIFAQQGAEIIFAPTWGNTLPDADGCVDGESTFRVRARDNGVYMVPSVYSGNSLIIDPRGRILASSQGRTGVFWAEVDLNQREPLPWVGHWRSVGPRHRRHDTFAPLVKPLH